MIFALARSEAPCCEEFDLLELLMRNAGIVLEYETICARIWGHDFGPESKNLAVYISYLRRKVAGWRASRIPKPAARPGRPTAARVPSRRSSRPIRAGEPRDERGMRWPWTSSG